MSKYYNIRWKQSDLDELRKAVKNFNAKITRLEKKNPEIKNALPEKITVKQMKELIDTRQDLKRELNSLKRFSQRGAEKLVSVPDNDYNLETTKWQKNEMSRRIGVINRKRKVRFEQISDIEATSRGQGLGYKVGDIGMGSADEAGLRPMKAFTPKMTRQDLNRKFRAIKRESQSTYWKVKEMRLKENVIRGLEANYNAPEYKEDIEQVIAAIEDMSFEEFYRKFKSEPGEMEIISPKPGQTMDSVLRVNVEALKSTWIPNYKK